MNVKYSRLNEDHSEHIVLDCENSHSHFFPLLRLVILNNTAYILESLHKTVRIKTSTQHSPYVRVSIHVVKHVINKAKRLLPLNVRSVPLLAHYNAVLAT